MAVGGGALLVGILSFFFLAKGLWRFLGCMTTFILMAVLVGAVFFFVSGSDMIKNLSESLTSALSKSESQQKEPAKTEQPSAQPVAEPTAQVPAQPTQASAIPAVGLPPGMAEQIQQATQPQSSVISGKITSIVSGDVFRMGQDTIRLYGLASPTIDQKCQDANGHTYDCGYVSARMLKDFVSGDDVNCRIMNFNARRELMAACSVKSNDPSNDTSYDIGAAMVEAGWAIALPAVTPIYLPYQQKAQEGRKGMWAGKFQMPWEWEAQQQQMKERTATSVPVVPVLKKKGKSLLDYL